ncbi:MAG: 23S rRNA pseudouridine(1911/1915/1917) synthase RluD [Legionellales bacterium]|nr:23S rRNA pseudouridine(1911/1915/1917) synthase RluD [Legionellales bacterium]
MAPHLIKEALVQHQHYGLRVDVVLAQLFPDFSRSQLSHWLKEGAITLDQQIYKPKDKVRGGERVTLDVDLTSLDTNSQPEDIPLEVMFEDEHVLVINKPQGLVVHPGAQNAEHTLVNALLHYDASLSQLPRAGIIHRLDKDTSGLLMIAKTFPAYTTLIQQMQARTIQRSYLALVYGHIIAGGVIDTSYGRHPRNRLKMAVTSEGKQAITHYAVKEHHHFVTLLDVRLMTGRTHQIRVHMAHLNHPIVGDPLYGGRARLPANLNDDLRQTLMQFKRQALHACSLSLPHPFSNKELTITAPLPDDFNILLQKIRQSVTHVG